MWVNGNLSYTQNISIILIFLLKKKGSIKEVKNAPVLMVTSATETLEILIALKNVIQCSAMRIPETTNLSPDFRSTKKLFFRNKK